MTKVVLACIGRFHHFHLARQLEKHGMLKSIWSGYPRFKLKDEKGIPAAKIRSYPWLHAPAAALRKLPGLAPIQRSVQSLAHLSLDRRVAREIGENETVIALSGNGLRCGARAKALGGRYYCDRGSSHIGYQRKLLTEEYEKWGLKPARFDEAVFEQELAEYTAADYVTVPSQFCVRSFIEMGVPPERIRKIPYGARLDRFSPQGAPEAGSATFVYVGAVSIRKGFLYLLEAFEKLKHPKKTLKVIGSISTELKPLIKGRNLTGVEFLGIQPNSTLAHHYSRAQALILPSIEEGLAMVMGEALACGCPLIASRHTGAEDLFTDSSEGFIIPIRSSDAILAAMETILADRTRADEMRHRARSRVETMGGWDQYGAVWARELSRTSASC